MCRVTERKTKQEGRGQKMKQRRIKLMSVTHCHWECCLAIYFPHGPGIKEGKLTSHVYGKPFLELNAYGNTLRAQYPKGNIKSKEKWKIRPSINLFVY